MRLKSSRVSVHNLHPQLFPSMMVADEVCRKVLGYEMIVTSCNDGRHSHNSDHYKGLAWDLRTWTSATSGRQSTPTVRKKLVKELKAKLDDEYFILDESTHIHISYRPHKATGERL